MPDRAVSSQRKQQIDRETGYVRKGSGRFRHRMRCSRGKNGCGRRFTLRQHPDSYARSPKCPYCKSVFVVSTEIERRKEFLAKEMCRCNPVPFKHPKGTVLGCIHHPKPVEEWTQEDEYDYQAMLDTPRTQWV